MKTLRPTEVNNTTVRMVEKDSIRGFVQSCAELLTGVVLDFGCGTQPYRDIVEAAGGEYRGYDRIRFPANVSAVDIGDTEVPDVGFDAVLCNQVAQYLPAPWHTLQILNTLLRPGGHLVMTYPTTWAEVEPEDLWRYTRTGMERLLAEVVGFEVVRHEQRAVIDLGGFRLPLGYGVLARA